LAGESAGESACPTNTQPLGHQSGTNAFVCQPGDLNVCLRLLRERLPLTFNAPLRSRLCLKYSYARILSIGRYLYESLTSMFRTLRTLPRLPEGLAVRYAGDSNTL
jgi:hypothetical protein